MTEYRSSPPAAADQGRLSRLRLRLLQGAWVLVTTFTLAVFVILIPVNYRATLVAADIERSMEILVSWITQQQLAVYIIALRYLAAAIFLVVAAIIFWRRRDDWVAVLTSITLTWMPLTFNLAGNVGALSITNPRKEFLENAYQLSYLLAVILIVLLMLVFPNGRFVPRWTRWLAWTMLPFSLAVSLIPLEDDYLLSGIAWAGVFAGFIGLALAAVISQIHRYRRVSTPLERQQTKWAFIGLIIYSLWLLGPLWWLASSAETPLANLITIQLEVLFPVAIPLSLGVSILRHRLWDIDVLIRRTLIYGALTGTLAVVFFTVVLVLQSLLPSQTNLTTVLSTLAIAALFSPLRRRIQSDIDRRFYRKKYEAAQILNSFSATVRDEVDLDLLSDALLRTLTEAVQPTLASLWLKPSVGAERSQPTHRHETEA